MSSKTNNLPATVVAHSPLHIATTTTSSNQIQNSPHSSLTFHRRSTMKPTTSLFLHLLLLLSLLIPPSTTTTTTTTTVDSSFVSFIISSKGLNFTKDLLISKAISSLIPLQIPQIDQTHSIPILGNVVIHLSNITIFQIGVSESSITLGDNSAVTIVVSGSTANLSLDWRYSYYSGWFWPIQVSDHGSASVEVEGMQVGLTFSLRNQEGSLKLSLLQCGCFVENLTIKLEGGASWLYQGLVDAFVGQIEAAVEQAIAEKLQDGILQLDSLLQSLPNLIPVDDIASLNVTFVNDPIIRNSSIGFEINGLFTPRDQSRVDNVYMKHLQTFSCEDTSKMIGISIDEAVFHSASTLYFEAGSLQWIVDKIPDQKLLNTAGWRFVIPQLYKKYPNDDMNLNVSFASPPVIRVSSQSIDVTVYVDIIINVLDAGEVIPVACILVEIQGSGSVNIRGNNLGGKVKLGNFKMTLKWSKIGNLKMFLIQPVLWTVVETVLLPYANTRLWMGFPLPIIQGFSLQNAKIITLDSSLNICSDLSYSESDGLAQVLTHIS